MKKILVAGSMCYESGIYADLLYNYLNLYIENDDDTIISGGARGVDTLAELFAKAHGILFIKYPAELEKYGKGAWYRRNAEMVTDCNEAIILWDGKSKGTKHTMDLLETAKKPYLLIRTGY